MAHFAELDNTNTVLRVIVVNNNDILNAAGQEDEQVGIRFLHGLFGPATTWVQTSYNGNFRGRYAGQGYTYDPFLDAFIAPQPYPSWIFDPSTTEWQPPVPMPSVPGLWEWDESTLSWINVEVS